jgi:hypothetical protein
VTVDPEKKTGVPSVTSTTSEHGTKMVWLDGTVDGTLVCSTMANPAVEKTITWVDGRAETSERAMTTGDDQVVGMVIYDGYDKMVTADPGTD